MLTNVDSTFIHFYVAFTTFGFQFNIWRAWKSFHPRKKKAGKAENQQILALSQNWGHRENGDRNHSLPGPETINGASNW